MAAVVATTAAVATTAVEKEGMMMIAVFHLCTFYELHQSSTISMCFTLAQSLCIRKGPSLMEISVRDNLGEGCQSEIGNLMI